jgi:L-ribulose-5-phosphate 3-epimerase
MQRRTFLRVGGGLVAAGFLPGAAPPKPAIRKAVKYEMIAGDAPVAEKLALIRRLGFDGVEMPAPADIDIDEAVAAAGAAGIVIHGVVDSEHWRSPLSDPDPAVRKRGRAALERALGDCRRYGGTTVLLVPAVVNGTVSYADAWTRSRDEIRAVLPLAEALQVRIALENVWNNFLLSPLEAARYVDGFESPWIGWYFDVGNVVRYGWPDQWIRILDRRVLKLDVKEYSRRKRDEEGLWKGFDVEIGDGDCDWPAVRAALSDVGYAGWATAEVRGGDAARLEDISQRMDRALGR